MCPLVLCSRNLSIDSAMQDTRAAPIVMLGCDAGNDEVEKAEASQILSAAAFGEREIEGEPLKGMKVHVVLCFRLFCYFARDALRERDLS